MKHVSFNGKMAFRVWNGQKTETRRPTPSQPPAVYLHSRNVKDGWQFFETEKGGSGFPGVPMRSRFGRVGSLLWIKEPYWVGKGSADMSDTYRQLTGYMAESPNPPGDGHDNRMASDMPRAFSRMMVAVTGLEIQRLQDIDEAALKSEGFADVEDMKSFWDQVYSGSQCWDSNPWVWVVRFKIAVRSLPLTLRTAGA